MTHHEPQVDPHPTLSSKRTRPNSFQATAQPVSLADALQIAPRLGELLYPSTLKSLLSTSRHLRCLVHARVTSVIIYMNSGSQQQLAELHVLTGGSWPCLQHVKLETGRLKISAIKQLSGACFSLTRLDLSRNSLDADAMSHLVLGKWPALKSLNLSYNKLDAAAIALLAQADWPLEELRLGDNRICAQAIKNLVQGNRLQLKELSLNGNMLRADSIRVLVKGQWPLRQLDLKPHHARRSRHCTACNSGLAAGGAATDR